MCLKQNKSFYFKLLIAHLHSPQCMEVRAHSGQELAAQSKEGLEWVWRGLGSRARG